jgi:hypothetical protein
VHVDEARRRDQAPRVDLALTSPIDTSEGGNAAVLDCDVATFPRPTGSVNDARVADD